MSTEQRIAAARRALVTGGLDTKRMGAWGEYGYPDHLTPSDFYKAYARHGLAHGAVNKLNGTCWGTDPWVIEGEKQDEKRKETPWERSVKGALPDDFWHVVAEVDKRRLIGRYAAMVLLVRDSSALDQPITKRTRLALDRVLPVWGTALTVTEWDPDERSPGYGKPRMYQYTETLQNGQRTTRKIHPDRVVIFGDMSDDAVGFLEAGYNNVVNLEKIEGGSGESFLKNSARQIHIDFDKEVKLEPLARLMGADSPAGIQDKLNEINEGLSKGIDKTLATQGATAGALTANVPDPKPHYDINVQTAAAGWDIPAKILVGMQTGERASSEDQKYWAARCQSRRVRELAREIQATVRQLQRIGVIEPMGVFTVMWDDLTVPTLAERLDNAKKMSDVNAAAVVTGDAVFDTDEIRSTAGFEAKADAQNVGEQDPNGSADPAA